MKCIRCFYWWKEDWEKRPSCHCDDCPAPCEIEEEEAELDEED